MPDTALVAWAIARASMKVPTRRWGNCEFVLRVKVQSKRLNESPHPKVGKLNTSASYSVSTIRPQ